MSRDIYFITHPDVVIDPLIPVPQWPLSERGRHRMRRLLTRDWIAHIEAIYSSTEQKAVDGAAILSETTVDAFFASPDKSIRGWEPAVAAQARIVGALERITRIAHGFGPIALVSHGGVGALLLCHLKGVPIANGRAAGYIGGTLLSLSGARRHTRPWLDANRCLVVGSAAELLSQRDAADGGLRRP